MGRADSGSSRVLRSQTNSQEEILLQSSSSPVTSPTRKSKSQRSSSKVMSESRRRSSRKSRNDELRDNELNVVAGRASARTTPTKKQPHKRSNESPSGGDTVANDSAVQKEEEGDEIEEDMDDDHDDCDDIEDDEEDQGIFFSTRMLSFTANFEIAMAEEARFMAAHRARAGMSGLGAMASLLSNQSSQLRSLLASLREPDPSIQLVALSELANVLSMSTEDSLAGYIQTDAFVVELVNIMRGPNAFGEDNPEMMLLACRCLANLMEALPSSTANIAYGGAIPVLCQKLLEIQFIDLAEQALSTLEKISKEYPTSIVRDGGMAACLTYLDFFSTNVQRTAVNTAANCAKNVPIDSFPAVRDVIPILQNVILGSDSKVVEAACLCLTRLIESFRTYPDRLEELLTLELLRSIISLLSPSQITGSTVPQYIHTRFLHVLGLGAKASPKLASEMLQQDLIGTIYQLLTGLSTPSSTQAIQDNSVVVLQALIQRPRDQVTEILYLISEILPGLPQEPLFEGLSQKEFGSRDERSKLFSDQCSSHFEQFATIVFPTLIDIYNSTVNATLRRTSLIALLKLCYSLETELLKRVVEDVPLAVFITGVLGATDLDLILSGTRIACILLDRLPSVYARKMCVEGCVAEIEILHSRYSATTLESTSHSGSDCPPNLSGGHDTDVRAAVTNDDDQVEVDDESESEEEDEEDHDEDDAGEDDSGEDLVTDDFNEEFASQSSNLIASPGLRTTGKDFPSLIRQTAQRFLKMYTSVDDTFRSRDDTLRKLEDLASELDSSNITEACTAISTLFESGEEISSYYLRASGILHTLLEVLTNDNKLENRQIFLEKCMTTNTFSILVSKLQELLSRAEKFEVLSTSSSEEKRSASVLAKQLRLKLVSDDVTDVPRPFRNLMVSIHAIATFQALDDYLRPRLLAASNAGSNRSSRTGTPSGAARASGSIGRAPEGLQGALAQLAAAGSSLPESIRERLAGLGVDTGALLGIGDATEEANSQKNRIGHMAQENENDDDESGPTVSVEVPSPGGKAIAKGADGRRIITPRAGTPAQSPVKPGERSQQGVGSSAADQQQIKRTSSSKQGVMSYAAAVSSTPTDWHIQFEVNGEVIAHETTIYGAVSRSQAIGDASTHDRPHASVYLIKFKKVPGPAPLPSAPTGTLPSLGQLPASIEREMEAAPILQLLDVLYALNTNWKDLFSEKTTVAVRHLPPGSFVNTKLTAKLNRQLEEPLIVASQCLPGWSQDLPRFYPFLFPFETRYLFLQSTSFGYSRSMSRWQSAAKKDHDDSRPFLGRLQRQKVRISRPRMLESAMKVMELYGASPSLLEVEYFNEVGTGLGPTLEFYSVVSTEFSKRKLNLWRDNESQESSEYVFANNGLFPRPLPSFENEQNKESTARSITLFKTLGIFLARAMIDSRIVNIPLNPAFFRLLGNSNDLPLSVGAVHGIDQRLAKSLSLVGKFSESYTELANDTTLSSTELREKALLIEFDNVHIEDLGLDFTYPGSPEIELTPGGSQSSVTIENVSDYLSKLLDFTLGSGIKRQLEAFRDGFSQVFPYTALRAFTPSELTMIFGGSEEDWTAETLLECIKADHGYTMDSSTIRNLVAVLSNLEETERGAFLQFITGSPRLPIGGFKSLTPQFTVVCKPYDAPLTADDYLPSVMTCVNYLKLPDYSSEAVLKSKLLMAMREGSGSFHLS